MDPYRKKYHVRYVDRAKGMFIEARLNDHELNRIERQDKYQVLYCSKLQVC